MKRIICMLLAFILLGLLLSACGKDERNLDEFYIDDFYGSADVEQNPQIKLNATVTDSTDFSNGFAWLQCTVDNGDTYLALVNAECQTIYSTRYGIEYLYADFGKTIGYYKDRDENGNDFYIIINAEGEIIASSQDGEFDMVLACGEENVFVYKNASDYAGRKHLYGFIDASGEWTLPPFELNAKFSGYTQDAAYVNCGMYRLGTTQVAAVINSKTGNITYLENFWHFTLPVFYDDKAIITTKDIREMSINGTDVYGFIELNKDGTYIAHTDIIREETSLNDNMIVKRDFDAKTVYIIDYINGTRISKSDLLSCTNINCTYFENGKAMLTFKGADYNNYFAVIDEKGNELIEPTLMYNAVFSEGIVVYTVQNKSSGERMVRAIDTAGNLLFESSEIKDVFKFYNKIGRVGDDYFVDIKGNRILEKIGV